MQEQSILSNRLINHLAPPPFPRHQNPPLAIQRLQPQLLRWLIGSQTIRTHLRLDVAQQRRQIRLLRHPLPFLALLIRHEGLQLLLGIHVGALERGSLPKLFLYLDMPQ